MCNVRSKEESLEIAAIYCSFLRYQCRIESILIKAGNVCCACVQDKSTDIFYFFMEIAVNDHVY